MDRPHFGRRARRKARARRRSRKIRIGVAVVALGAMTAGMPGSDTGLDLIGDLSGIDPDDPETTESAASAMRFRRVVFEHRPTPRPTASGSSSQDAAVGASESITAVIYAASAEFGLSGSYLLSVAACESGLDPTAYNPAGYYGLFQFDLQTWSAYGYGSVYDPVAQARTAARLLAAGQASRWPNCA